MDEVNRNIFWMSIGVAGIIFFFFSFYSLYNNWYEIKWIYLNDTNSLSKVEGMILHAEIGHGQELENSHGSSKSVYFPDITYSFFVENVKYKSNKQAFAEIKFTNRASAELYLSNYPVGSKVLVYYDSSNPGISVLDPNRKGSYILEFVGILFLPSFILAFVVRRHYKLEQAGALVEEKLDNLISTKENNEEVL